MRFAKLIVLCLSACTGFPVLDDTIDDTARDAPFPVLMPIPVPDRANTTDLTVLDSRIAALRARAARLRELDAVALQ